MTATARLIVIAGTSPVVLVAPHGGRRDPGQRPWGSRRLRVNDLHTAALTAELAARLDASALINAAQDRNQVDLNRIGEAHDGAPGFLARLIELLEATLGRHGRATLLTVHGWNVIQPALDLGLGCTPGDDPFVVDQDAAVSPAFAAGALRRLVEACVARGLSATIGARYPARHRENLLQLFTPRYRDDVRQLVRALAALAPRVDAVQLELGIPLRWPGPWRTAFLDACAETLPALAQPPPATRAHPPDRAAPPSHAPLRLQFTSPTLCGLIALDAPGGGRLLFFPPTGGLVLFTGERVGGERLDALGPLSVRTSAGGCQVRLCGPLLRFPDTLPFLDLEPGLAGAELVHAEVALDFTADDAPTGDPGARFGTVTGLVRLDGVPCVVDGPAFCDPSTTPAPWPRLRAQLHLGERSGLVLALGLPDGPAAGFFQRAGTCLPIVAARAVLGPRDAPLARVELDLELADGTRVMVAARALHHLPVIHRQGPHPVRLEFAACQLEGGPPWPAGWCELGGV